MFADSLDDRHEAKVMVSGILVHEFSISETGLITFYGEYDGKPAQIIQSFESINIHMFAVEIPDGKPKEEFQMGFIK